MPASQTTPAASLSSDELERYGRHLTLPNVGPEGQRKLKASSVLLVGAGGLASPAAMYLAAAGVGRLGLVDFDAVETSNLQRQLLHDTDDVGRPKLASARERIRAINPNVTVETHETRLTSDNALDVIDGYDVVADGTDNFPTRYLVNDACVFTGTPNVYASIFQFEGQASVFGMPDGPCYRCAFPEPPPPGQVPSCAEGGVLGVLPGLAGTIQATEAVKVLLNIGEPLAGRLLLIDALAMNFRTMQLSKDPDCPVCGEQPTQTDLIDYEQFCGIMPSDDQDSVHDDGVPGITVQRLKEQRDAGEAPFLLDVRRPTEYEIANLGGTLIPVSELAERLDELAGHRDEEIVVHCRSGARSAQAVELLREHGFEHAKNLKGGILAWSKEIDPNVPQY
jgi:adenylyltransferase/sulfurtransferase